MHYPSARTHRPPTSTPHRQQLPPPWHPRPPSDEDGSILNPHLPFIPFATNDADRYPILQADGEGELPSSPSEGRQPHFSAAHARSAREALHTMHPSKFLRPLITARQPPVKLQAPSPTSTRSPPIGLLLPPGHHHYSQTPSRCRALHGHQISFPPADLRHHRSLLRSPSTDPPSSPSVDAGEPSQKPWPPLFFIERQPPMPPLLPAPHYCPRPHRRLP